MAFILNRVSFKASGDRIDRMSTVDGDALTIGRDSSCDVHLPDLAVNPKHAKITRIDDGHLMIEALSDQPFTVNGRSVNRREIDLTRGSELAFGGHRITVSRDAASGNPLLEVQRVEAVSEASEDKDYTDAYTLKGLLPGKRISAWAFFALVLAAALAWPIYTWSTWKDQAGTGYTERDPKAFHADTLWMSGGLSDGHKKLEKDCQACHVDAFVAVTDEACLSCHTPGKKSMTGKKSAAHIVDADGKENKALLIAARGQPEGWDKLDRDIAHAFNRPEGRCVECHSEHGNEPAMQPAKQSECADCHDGMDARLRMAGMETKLGNAADFGTDHPQFRPTVIVDPTAEKPVLQRTLWTENITENNGLKFTHAQHLNSRNAVAQMVIRRPEDYGGAKAMECKDCHTMARDKVSFLPVDMETSCQGCHSLGFDEVGGTVRTLRHGQPAMVIADLRAFFRSGAPPRPVNLGGMARRRPGEVNIQRTARDYARAVRLFPSRADQAIQQVFSKGGACYDCHTVTGGSAGGGGYGIQKVAQNDTYLNKGWFSHADHDTGTMQDCLTCHVDAASTNDPRKLLIPGLDGQGGCRYCHTGETGIIKAGQPVQQRNGLTSPMVETTCAQCHEYHVSGGIPYLLRTDRAKDKKLGPNRLGGDQIISSREPPSPLRRRVSWQNNRKPDHGGSLARRPRLGGNG